MTTKCFYLLNDDFGGKFQNPFSPKLFTEIFGDLIKKKTHRTFVHRKFSQLMYVLKDFKHRKIKNRKS